MLPGYPELIANVTEHNECSLPESRPNAPAESGVVAHGPDLAECRAQNARICAVDVCAATVAPAAVAKAPTLRRQ